MVIVVAVAVIVAVLVTERGKVMLGLLLIALFVEVGCYRCLGCGIPGYRDKTCCRSWCLWLVADAVCCVCYGGAGG